MKVLGVNGFGRIGRYFTRMSLQDADVNVAVVNDLAPIKTLAHLFKYDSIHGKLPLTFIIDGNSLVFENGKRILFTQERNPELIPWGENGVEVVVECTGIFRSKELAMKHITAGAKKVIISAPTDSTDVRTIVLGINDSTLDEGDVIISNASCTTNNIAPMFEVMKSLGKLENAFITTIHSYTTDQSLHDSPHSDLRRARAAGMSIVPTTTGAAKAITKIFPEYEGKIGGGAMRVPVPDGSLSDITMMLKSPVTAEEVNKAMKAAAEGYLKGILEYTEDPIVSVDVIGNPNSCIFDAELTSCIGRMVKIVGWYDNEAGYSNRLLDLAKKL